ncbi:MAG: tetratricopeptide repeat protein [Bacteroidota bacterium]
MKDQRIKQLEKYLLDDPNDTFSLYALALELWESDAERTAELFKELLEKHPSYEGTYYQAAAFFAEQGDREMARSIYEKGIELLQTNNSTKALHELRNAYQNFEFDDD